MYSFYSFYLLLVTKNLKKTISLFILIIECESLSTIVMSEACSVLYFIFRRLGTPSKYGERSPLHLCRICMVGPAYS